MYYWTFYISNKQIKADGFFTIPANFRLWSKWLAVTNPPAYSAVDVNESAKVLLYRPPRDLYHRTFYGHQFFCSLSISLACHWQSPPPLFNICRDSKIKIPKYATELITIVKSFVMQDLGYVIQNSELVCNFFYATVSLCVYRYQLALIN